MRHPGLVTLREDLHEWLAAQAAWQQDLARRLVARTQLDGAAYDEALSVVLNAFGALAAGQTAPDAQPIALTDLPMPAAASAPRLLGFGRLRGVGAIADDQELRFRPDGLTVIYGPNAAGKTSYVRALKRVCRTVDCDAEVRGNVYAAPGPTPTATVEYSMGGSTRSQQVDLRTPQPLGLEAISVFDSRCAELYIDSRNAVAFVPSALLLLARLAATQDRMRTDIQSEIQRIARQRPSFEEVNPGTAVRALLDGLTAETDVETLRRAASLTDEARARITELRAALASAAAQSVRADAAAAHQDATQATALAARLRDLTERVAPAVIETLNARAADSAAANEAVALAAREFAGLPIEGVGSDPWRRLWQAARDFAAGTPGGFPPTHGSPCPLCLQELSEDAAERLAHFERHVQSEIGTQASNAQRALTEALDPLGEEHIAAVRSDFLSGLAEREPELHAAIEGLLGDLTARTGALRADPTAAPTGAPPTDAIAMLEAWAQNRESHSATLAATENPEQEAELRRELAELEARERLAPRLTDAEAWIAALKRSAALQQAHSALATNRITIKQRELSETAVTGVLDSALKAELSSLHCEHLPVDLHPQTVVGETQVALRLAGAHGAPSVSEIASEGEQRALSLSFFLAEVSTSASDGGIIVDDPVSSLDDERRAYIAERLVAEARHRQVIVLTHDLPFMLDLIDQAEDAGLEPMVEGIWRLGSEVGRVDDHPPFRAMKLRPRVGVLEQQVAQWNNQPPPADFDEAWRRVCDFYARLRITWERAVEERLFRGVVQRFQREVKTLWLDDVEITPELVAAVKDGMTRCSQFVHDQPPGATTSLPGRTELAADLEKIREFEKQTRP